MITYPKMKFRCCKNCATFAPRDPEARVGGCTSGKPPVGQPVVEKYWPIVGYYNVCRNYVERQD